ncbi:MAG: hypothetical protein V1728_01755 [Candidatus Micrarchaeota archaeon]
MLFDKTSAIAIAAAFGLAGLPWGWWLMRKDAHFGKFEKTVLGYALGLMMIPALFMLENILGINYSPAFIALNWALVFFGGLAALYYDMKKNNEKFEIKPEAFYPDTPWLPTLGVLLLMASGLLIGWSGSGTPLYELDPYYYMEGVHQVVYEGHNYVDDGTAWYPLVQSTHIGQPLWKYLLAPWYSLYNGNAAYSPYILNAVGSIYPPIIGALSVFFMYMLFKIIYNPRIGFFAAGSLAFMPVMLSKFMGGDTQIAPYNVFGLTLLLCGLAYAMHRPKELKSVLFAMIGYAAIALGSNVESVVLLILPVAIGMISLEYFFNPTAEKSKDRFEFAKRLILAVVLVRLAYFAYSLRGGFELGYSFSVMLPTILSCVLALAVPWALGEGLKMLEGKDGRKSDEDKARSAHGSRAGAGDRDLGLKAVTLVVVAFVAMAGFLALRDVGPVKTLVSQYVFFGAYTTPLTRTIAEQGAGSQVYNDQLGFLASPLDLNAYYAYRVGPNVQPGDNPFNATGSGLLAGVYSGALAIAALANALPTVAANTVYAVFIALMNLIAGFETFIYIEKINSLLTLFAFGSILLVVADFLWEVYNNRPWPAEIIMLVPIVVPIMLMSFQKQKLVLYLGIMLVLSAAMFFGRLERLVGAYLASKRKEKKKDGKAGLFASIDQEVATLRGFSAGLMIVLVLVQFLGLGVFAFQYNPATASGTQNGLNNIYNSNTPALLKYSMTPRIYDDPKGVLAKLVNYCQNRPDDPACPSVNNWDIAANDPALLFNPNLCARSLWPYTAAQPADIGVAMGYRCSFVSDYWLASMEWMGQNVPRNERVISWWDYGHWTNFFGQTKTVLRNEHASDDMIGRTAWSYLMGNATDLRKTMKDYGSRYALIDIEILGSGTDRDHMQLGGKYGALNYIGCGWINQTTVNNAPGTSDCELAHMWEYMLVPTTAQYSQACMISETTGKSGVIAYRLVDQKNKDGIQKTAAPAFCVMQGKLADGSDGLLVYDLNQKDANGDLAPYYARWMPQSQDSSGSIIFAAIYDHKKLWTDATGQPVDSWGNRQNAFYNSTLYQGFFLDSIEGFDLVYSTPQIRIFRMSDAYWNAKE